MNSAWVPRGLQRRTGTPLARCLERPRPVMWTAALLFVAISVLRWFVDRNGQAAALLYVVPIALLALCFGRRAGIAAALAGAALFSVFAIFRGQGDLDFTGWVDPIAVMFVAGCLLGGVSSQATENAHTARIEADRRARLEDLCGRQQEALEVSDAMVQGAAVARWMIECGETGQAMDALSRTVSDCMRRLSPLLGAGPQSDISNGSKTVSSG